MVTQFTVSLPLLPCPQLQSMQYPSDKLLNLTFLNIHEVLWQKDSVPLFKCAISRQYVLFEKD